MNESSCQSFTSLRTTLCYNFSTITRCHARSKPMSTFTNKITWLESAFHFLASRVVHTVLILVIFSSWIFTTKLYILPEFQINNLGSNFISEKLIVMIGTNVNTESEKSTKINNFGKLTKPIILNNIHLL